MQLTAPLPFAALQLVVIGSHWERLGTLIALIRRGASSLAGLGKLLLLLNNGILTIRPLNAAIAGEQQICGRTLKGKF